MGKTEIKLCMGSSCFSRGNEALLDVITNFLNQHNLVTSVDFKGHLCEGDCTCGPNISIAGKKYSEIDEKNIISILSESLGV